MGPRLFSRGYVVLSRANLSRANLVSMGPRLFSRGYREMFVVCEWVEEFQWGHDFSAVDTRIIVHAPRNTMSCFNGATTFQPWIPRPWSKHPSTVSLFQWGHDFSAVDTAILRRCSGYGDHIPYLNTLSIPISFFAVSVPQVDQAWLRTKHCERSLLGRVTTGALATVDALA